MSGGYAWGAWERLKLHGYIVLAFVVVLIGLIGKVYWRQRSIAAKDAARRLFMAPRFPDLGRREERDHYLIEAASHYKHVNGLRKDIDALADDLSSAGATGTAWLIRWMNGTLQRARGTA